MSLRAGVQRAVIAAFKAVSDIARPATYKSLTGAMVRDLDAGTSVPVSVNYLLKRTVFARFRESEVDENVSVLTDQKFLFPALDLPVQPKTADLVVDEDGRTWEITRRLSDPASALVILQARTSR